MRALHGLGKTLSEHTEHQPLLAEVRRLISAITGATRVTFLLLEQTPEEA